MKTKNKGTKLLVYSLEKKTQMQPLVLTKLSECLKYTYESSLKHSKNTIIIYPENIFRPATYFAYIFMKNYNKDVLFFTTDIGEKSNNPYQNHLEKFCLMQEQGRRGFIWHKYLPCVLENNKLNIKIIFKKGVKNEDKAYFDSQLNSNLNADCANFNKLIFSKKMLNANSLNNIKEIIFEKKKYQFENNIGLCIFENLSNKINNEKELNNFVEWLDPLIKNDIHFIFHISNYIDTRFINKLQEKTNSVVFYASPDLLHKGKDLFSQKDSLQKLSLSYNLDNEEIYEKDKDKILAVPIFGQGISTKQIYRTLKEVENNNKIPSELLSRIKKLIFLLPKLTVHPSSWGRSLSYKFEDNEFRSITVKTFFRELDNYIKKTNVKQIEPLAKLRDQLVALYANLDETDRYGEDHPYTRISKPYQLIELIKTISAEDDISEIIIGVFDGREKNVLNKKLDLFFGHKDDKVKNNITAKTINQLSYLNENTNSRILILPSYLLTKHFSEYFKSYKKIYVLVYEGDEEKQCANQRELINYANLKFIDISIKYFKGLYKSLNWKKDIFIDKIDKLKIKEDIEMPEIKQGKIDAEEDLLQRIKDKISKDDNLKELKENDDLFDDSKDELLYESEYKDMKKDYLLILSSIEDGDIKKIELSKTKTLLYINDKKEVEEKEIKELQNDDLVILIQGDERKSFIDYIAKRTGIDDEIDLYHIKVWKEKLNQFMEEKNINNNELFLRYKKLGGNIKTNPFHRWKDSIQNIAPRNKDDLRIIGSIIGYKYLSENTEELFRDINQLRTTHRIIGREINNIIKKKISGNTNNLSFDNFDISNQLRIYKIKKITKRDQ